MDKSGLFKSKFIGDYENTPDKRWTTVVDLFAKNTTLKCVA